MIFTDLEILFLENTTYRLARVASDSLTNSDGAERLSAARLGGILLSDVLLHRRVAFYFSKLILGPCDWNTETDSTPLSSSS